MKKVILRVLAVLTSLLLLPLWAFGADDASLKSGQCGESTVWTLDADGVLTVSGKGKMADYYDGNGSTAPWKMSDIKKLIIEDGVTTVGQNAFQGAEALTYVSLPDSLESINQMAFYGCKALKSIALPEGMSVIYNMAFSNSGLTSVRLPSSLTHLGGSAFEFCYELSSIDMPSAQLKELDEGVLSHCRGLKSVTVPEGIEELRMGAFWNCFNLKSIELPQSLKSIETMCFDGCDELTDIKFNGTVEQWKAVEISGGNGSFPDKRVTCADGVFDPSAQDDGERNKCGDDLKWSLDGGTLKISGSGNMYDYSRPNTAPWSSYADSITAVEFESGVTSVGSYAFYNCSNIESAVLCDGISRIGSYAFYDCGRLTGVSLPEGLKNIEDLAFSYCESLVSVSIPESIKSIGSGAFDNCNALKEINYNGTASQWADVSLGDSNEGLKKAEISFKPEPVIPDPDPDPDVPPTPGKKTGDINSDGAVDLKDVCLMRRMILGVFELTDSDIEKADLNGDGRVDTRDAFYLKRGILLGRSYN